MLYHSIGLIAIFALRPPRLFLLMGREYRFTPLELAVGDERLVNVLTEFCCIHDSLYRSIFYLKGLETAISIQ